MTITAAADGSALGNPGPAGWAWYVDDAHWGSGGWTHATNNMGELMAVLDLFRATAHLDDDLLVLCDSQYVINSVTKWMPGWKKKGWRKSDGKPVMNLELLREIDAALVGRRYRFEWVKGHANHPLNEAADARARGAAEAHQSGRTIPTGPGWAGVRHALATSAGSAPEPLSDPVDGERTRGGSTGPAPEVSGTAAELPAIVEAATDERATQPGLFDFDEPAEHVITLRLDDAEHTRLLGRARLQGVGIEELLRSLI